MYFCLKLPSASSWGCELKWQPCPRWWQWKMVSLFVRLWVEMISVPVHSQPTASQPLREAVSWNSKRFSFSSSAFVSLFVRLWVEMTASAAAEAPDFVSLFVRLWVEIILIASRGFRPLVSLFVRLWVEIPIDCASVSPACSQPLREAVSWNAFSANHYLDRIVSASSWGCELK